MRDFRDAKAMAQTLREALKTKSINLTHSESLELIAKSFGVPDWNVLAAKIQATEPVIREPVKPDVASLPIPGGIPVAAMRDVAFFPRMVTPIFAARAKTMRAIEHALATDGLLFVIMQRRSGDDDPDFDALHRVGVTASIINHMTLPDKTMKLFVSCLERKTVGRSAIGECLVAEALPFTESNVDTLEAAELSRAVLDRYSAYAKLPPGYAGLARLPGVENPGMLADSVVPFLAVSLDKKQQLLETGDVVARLKTILDLMAEGAA